MDAHDFMNFFLSFYYWLIKIFCMKGKIFVFGIGFVISGSALGDIVPVQEGSPLNPTYVYNINGVDDMYDMPSVPQTPFKILVNNGDDNPYPLSVLDSISDGANEVKFALGEGGPATNSNIIWLVDDAFDGTFDAPIVQNSTIKIQLSDAVLNSVSADGEIVHFTGITGNTNAIYFYGEYDNVYEIGACSNGIGTCIKRRYSNSHIAEQQAEQRAIQIARIGARNNPKILLRPMMLINQYELSGIYNFSDEFYISVSPEYYSVKDFQNAGIRINSGTKFGGRLYVGASVYLDKSNFQNDVSDFKSDIYGGNLRFRYDIDDVLFLRGVGGISFASIECDNVINGDSVINNPNAFGVYGGMDFGAMFNFESGIYVSPFVGYDVLSGSVVGIRDNNSFAHFGTDVGFKYFMDGVSYGYMLRGGINSDGFFDASVGIDIGSVSDKIGGGVSIGVLDTDYGLSGKLSANVRFAF